MPDTKGSNLLKGIENITKILNGVTAAANAFNSARSIINLVLGKGGGLNSVESALQSIAADMNAGFDKIVNAINLQTLQQEWQTSGEKLREMQRTGQSISTQFLSFTGDPDTPKVWEVQAFAQKVPFRDWCEKGVPGTQQGPVLTQLAKMIDDLSTLVGVGSPDFSPSMIDLWDRIIASAQAANVSGFAGLTSYELMYRLMQAIFATLGTFYYMHEAILALYYQQNPSNPANFVSAAPLVQQTFGDVDTPGSLWGMFDATMSAYVPTAEDPTQYAPAIQYGTSATTGDSAGAAKNASPITFFASGDPTGATFTYVWTNICELGPNAFFSNLQWQTVTYHPANEGLEVNAHQVAYLQGTPVTLGPNFAVTTGAPVPVLNPAAPDFASMLGFAFAKSDNPGSKHWRDVLAYAFINTSYSPAPALANANLLPVVTGFKIMVKPNRYVLSLKYAQLDITDPANPKVEAIPGVQWVDNACTFKNDPNFFALGKWDYWRVNINQIDLRPAGSTALFPMTNASFCQTGPTTQSGTQLGLIVQSAWPVYRAGFFQPTGALTAKPVPTPPGWSPPAAVTEEV